MDKKNPRRDSVWGIGGGLVLATAILCLVGQKLDDNVTSLIGFSDSEFAIIGQIVIDCRKQFCVVIDAAERIEHKSSKLKSFACGVCGIIPAATHDAVLASNKDNVVAAVLALVDP